MKREPPFTLVTPTPSSPNRPCGGGAMGASSSSNLTEAARAVHLFKINGYSATTAMGRADSLPSRRLAAGGYEWEVHYTASHDSDWHYWAALRCRLLAHRPSSFNPGTLPQQYGGAACFRDAGGDVDGEVSHAFRRAGESSGWLRLRKRNVLEASGAIEDDAFTVECAITVITERPDAATADALMPSSGLQHQLGELLRTGTGADVTLVVSGEPFAAHRAVLAARSPVFMAEFFGHMKERSSPRVEIKDMEAAVFRAMLRFVYTDTAPELDREGDDGDVFAQHLLAAAHRYGLDRLKLMCEDKLCDGAGVATAATILALAEQHGCSRLKARCVELVAGNLDGVMATEGYKHLMASCPSVMGDILMAVRGTNN
ncbi:hypothetical protein ACP4OV_014093 [Aristida adscensionis]